MGIPRRWRWLLPLAALLPAVAQSTASQVYGGATILGGCVAIQQPVLATDEETQGAADIIKQVLETYFDGDATRTMLAQSPVGCGAHGLDPCTTDDLLLQGEQALLGVTASADVPGTYCFEISIIELFEGDCENDFDRNYFDNKSFPLMMQMMAIFPPVDMFTFSNKLREMMDEDDLFPGGDVVLGMLMPRELDYTCMLVPHDMPSEPSSAPSDEPSSAPSNLFTTEGPSPSPAVASTAPSFDHSAAPSFDHSAAPSLDHSAAPSFDHSTSPSLPTAPSTTSPAAAQVYGGATIFGGCIAVQQPVLTTDEERQGAADVIERVLETYFDGDATRTMLSQSPMGCGAQGLDPCTPDDLLLQGEQALLGVTVSTDVPGTYCFEISIVEPFEGDCENDFDPAFFDNKIFPFMMQMYAIFPPVDFFTFGNKMREMMDEDDLFPGGDVVLGMLMPREEQHYACMLVPHDMPSEPSSAPSDEPSSAPSNSLTTEGPSPSPAVASTAPSFDHSAAPSFDHSTSPSLPTALSTMSPTASRVYGGAIILGGCLDLTQPFLATDEEKQGAADVIKQVLETHFDGDAQRNFMWYSPQGCGAQGTDPCTPDSLMLQGEQELLSITVSTDRADHPGSYCFEMIVIEPFEGDCENDFDSVFFDQKSFILLMQMQSIFPYFDMFTFGNDMREIMDEDDMFPDGDVLLQAPVHFDEQSTACLPIPHGAGTATIEPSEAPSPSPATGQCQRDADCATQERCQRNPQKCKCMNNKCKKKKKDCKTKGNGMQWWGCNNGKTCVAKDNQDGVPKMWGRCTLV